MKKWIALLAIVFCSVLVLAQGEGNTIMLKFAGVPSGPCSFIMVGLNSANGNLYSCPAGSWVLAGGGSSGSGTVSPNNGVTNVIATYALAGGSTTVGPASTSSPAACLPGATSGEACFTAPAVAGTSTNPVTMTNVLAGPNGSQVAPTYGFTGCTTCGIFWVSGAGLELTSDSGSHPIQFNFSGSGQTSQISSTQMVLGLNNTNAVNLVLGGGGTNQQDSGVNRLAVSTVGIGSSQGSRNNYALSANSVFVTSNFTTAANTSLQTITGLLWIFPATALNWNFHCHLAYSQATGTAAVAFGIQAATNAPTNIFATGEMFTAAGTVTTGVLPTLTTTTATNIVSGTPGATGTNLVADLHGTLELPASANTVNIMVSTATSGDAVTVLRGSYCSLTP